MIVVEAPKLITKLCSNSLNLWVRGMADMHHLNLNVISKARIKGISLQSGLDSISRTFSHQI